METQLRHSLKDGSTVLRGRLKLSTPSDTVSRTYVGLNTTKSRIDIEGYLRQFWCFLGRKHGPVDNRLRLGLGAHYFFGSGLREKLFVGPVIKKEFHFQPRHATQALSANLACACEWDTSFLKASKPVIEGKALLNYKVMRFMKRQDVKLTAGSRLFWSGDRLASFKLAPVLRVRENNWSALVEFEDPRRYLGSVFSSSTAKASAPKASVLISYDL